MKPRLAAVGLALSVGTNTFGHRLDEYLQATTISVAKDSVQVQIRLTPGVAVFRHVMATIDTDRDGAISRAEQRKYSARVLADLSLSIDGDHLRLHQISATYPTVEQMKDGLGVIQIDFAADVPLDGRERRLVFENHHQSAIAAFLVNCLVPRDPDIHILGQNRNYEQSLYRLDYSQGGVQAGPLSLGWWSGGRAWVGSLGVLLLVRLAGLWRQRLQTARGSLAV